MINYDEIRLLSSQQAANYLGISAGTLDAFIKSKEAL
jgi:hypothetical protein